MCLDIASGPLYTSFHFILQELFEVGAVIPISRMRKLRYRIVKQLSRIMQVSKPGPKLRVCPPQTHPLDHSSSLPFYAKFTLNFKHIGKMPTSHCQPLAAPCFRLQEFLPATCRAPSHWGNDRKGLDLSALPCHRRVYWVPSLAGCAPSSLDTPHPESEARTQAFTALPCLPTPASSHPHV